MRLRGAPPAGELALSYVTAPEGTIVGFPQGPRGPQGIPGDPALDPKSVTRFGVKADGKYSYAATISSGALNTVVCSDYSFTSDDIGKTIVIAGGASSVSHQAHVTTIASVSSGHAVLTTAAAHPITSQPVVWGTDDGPAWVEALTHAITNPPGELVMPAGISICGQSTTIATTNQVTRFSLRGASSGASRIVSTAPGGFLTLDCTGEVWNGILADVTVTDLTLFAALAGNSRAVSVTTTPGSPGSDHHTATIERVICGSFWPDSGVTQSTQIGYWDKPIEVIGAFMPVLRDVLVYGLGTYQPTDGSGDFSDTSVMYLPTLGVNLDGAFAPHLYNVQVYRCKRGIQSASAVSWEWVIDPVVDGCIIISCKEGLYLSPGTGIYRTQNPFIHGCQFNNRDFNMALKDVQLANVSNNMIQATPSGWSVSSTLAVAVPTGSTPATLTLASTVNFPEVGAVQIGNEWFTYNNLATGMDGTTLHVTSRGEFGSADPGSNYAIGTTVTPSTADILLINTDTVRINNSEHSAYASTHRVSVMAHSANTYVNVSNSRHNTRGIAEAIAKDSTFTEIVHDTVVNGTTPILNGAVDTIYRPIVDLVPTVAQFGPTYTAAPGDLVVVNASSRPVTVQLPPKPPNLTRVSVTRIDGILNNAVTVNRGGSDLLYSDSGPTSLTLNYQGSTFEFEYRVGVWYVLSESRTLAALDSRYLNKSTTGTAAGITGKTTPTGALVGTTDTQPLTHKDLTDASNTFPTSLEQTANKNAANGYCGLDGGGKVAAAQLPSYVDDVLEYANLAAFPGTGTAGIIYVALDSNKAYRWSGSGYIEISPSPGSTDAVAEGATNLYYTPARVDGRIAASSSITPAASTLAKWDANLNLGVNNILPGAATTPTAAGTTVLTIASAPVQIFTGSTIHAVNLPSTGVTAGMQFVVVNQATGIVTVQSSAGNSVAAMAFSVGIFIANKNAPTAAGDWTALIYQTGSVIRFPSTAGSDTLASINATQTFSNKRVNPRVISVASSATPAINTDSTDVFEITALAAAITSMTSGLTGTPVDGQRLRIRIKDNGTARAIAWGSSFISSGLATLLSTTVAGKTHLSEFVYDSASAKWVCLLADAAGY